MRATRREILLAASAGAAATMLSGCKTVEQEATGSSIEQPDLATAAPLLVKLLNRAAFGPAPYEVARINEIGAQRWIDEQLDHEKIDEQLALIIRVNALGDTLDADPGLLFDMDDHRCVATLRQATLLRAVYSRRQLYERTVNFWSDHFNIYAFKGQDPQYKLVDDRETIRKHALGNFHDLLLASAQSAAMLGYLDNEVNRKGVPNENYARELLELHTLGLGGGYTQHDIQEIARCFTGWSVQQNWHRGAFNFDSTAHDNGEKHVLGVTIPAGGGQEDGMRVLEIVSHHPSTARHLSVELCRYFLGASPYLLVTRLAGIFQSTNGEIKPMLRALLNSPEFTACASVFKRPFDFLASSLRSLGADTDGGTAVLAHLDAMGQSPFGWPMPDGYPMRDTAWIGGLIPRWKYAADLTGGQIDNTSVDLDSLMSSAKGAKQSISEAAVEALFIVPVNSERLGRLRQELDRYSDGRLSVAVALMSPEFQYA